jgi:hypothetical protein
MVSLAELWLPILLSAVFVFVASSIIHMATPMHKGDFRKMPGEDRVMAEMRAQGLVPGSYMFPCAGSMKDMGTPEMIEKCKQGPVGMLNVIPSGAPGMGKNLAQWFGYLLLISVFTAYAAMLGLDRDAEFTPVFRLAGTVATLSYATHAIPDSIWHGQTWGVTFKFLIDGIIYGLITGAMLGWLWPGGA